MNIKRGFGRIRKVLKVWGYMVATLTIFFIFIAVMNFLEGYIEEAFEVLKWGIIAWAPFLLFKLLFWILRGFLDEE